MKLRPNRRAVPTRFGPETRFELRPGPVPTFRDVQNSTFEDLKEKLVVEKLNESWDVDSDVLIRRAAHEAAALAWQTPYPTLVFPQLLEEKIATAAAHSERQADVLRVSRELLAV